jgi:hypothetical protein
MPIGTRRALLPQTCFDFASSRMSRRRRATAPAAFEAGCATKQVLGREWAAGGRKTGANDDNRRTHSSQVSSDQGRSSKCAASLAKVGVAGSNPVVRSKEDVRSAGQRPFGAAASRSRQSRSRAQAAVRPRRYSLPSFEEMARLVCAPRSRVQVVDRRLVRHRLGRLRAAQSDTPRSRAPRVSVRHADSPTAAAGG